MHKRTFLAGVAVGAWPAVRAQSAPPIVWRLATGYRAETFHTQNLLDFAREVGERTSGRLRIEVSPNNSLVKLGDIPKAVSAGTIEAGEAIMVGMSADIPLAGADGVPFVVNGYEAAERMWALQQPSIEKELALRGMKAMYAVPWPPQGLYTDRPIRRSSDLAGLKMRTYNATTVRIAELLKAQAVDVPMVQVAQALAGGRMNAMITSAVTGVENKVWSGLKHYYELNAWLPKNLIFVNAKSWARLSPEDQRGVTGAASRAQTRGFALSEAAARTATDELRKNGIKVEPTPMELGRDLKRMGERFAREWISSVGSRANEIFVPFYAQS